MVVPPGASHTFGNAGEETVVLLNTFTPDLYVQYLRDLGDLVAAGKPPTDAAILELMANYATYPADQPAPRTEGRA